MKQIIAIAHLFVFLLVCLILLPALSSFADTSGLSMVPPHHKVRHAAIAARPLVSNEAENTR